MARLAHNDYLQQASDSGWGAFVGLAVFFWGSVVVLYRKRIRLGREKALWLGVAAFATQSVVEFGLYIPALAWPAFLFLGGLWACDLVERSGFEKVRNGAKPSSVNSNEGQ